VLRASQTRKGAGKPPLPGYDSKMDQRVQGEKRKQSRICSAGAREEVKIGSVKGTRPDVDYPRGYHEFCQSD
jgi:hypothetical protein